MNDASRDDRMTKIVMITMNKISASVKKVVNRTLEMSHYIESI